MAESGNRDVHKKIINFINEIKPHKFNSLGKDKGHILNNKYSK